MPLISFRKKIHKQSYVYNKLQSSLMKREVKLTRVFSMLWTFSGNYNDCLTASSFNQRHFLFSSRYEKNNNNFFLTHLLSPMELKQLSKKQDQHYYGIIIAQWYKLFVDSPWTHRPQWLCYKKNFIWLPSWRRKKKWND